MKAAIQTSGIDPALAFGIAIGILIGLFIAAIWAAVVLDGEDWLKVWWK